MRQSAKPICPADGGFTLVELVVTLVLIAILAAYAIPGWPGRTPELRSETDQLKSYIRYAQSLAMARGQRYRINLLADRYGISDLAGNPVPHPATGANQVMLGGGIVLATTHGLIAFDGRGVPYTDTTIPGTALGADAVITLSVAGETRTLRVSPETGRVWMP